MRRSKMFKKMVMVLVLLALTLGVSGLALAEERVEFRELKLTSVREEPINLPSYTASGLDFVSEVIARLLKSGQPAVVFGETTKAAIEVTLWEKLIGLNINLVGGMTLQEGERSEFVIGVKYTGMTERTGGIWDIFSKFEPTVYNIEGQWFIGLSYDWREQTTE